MRAIIALFIALAAVIVVRLVMIQVLEHEAHETYADRTWAIETKGPRGAILDRNGFPLATSIDAWEVHVDTRLWARSQFQPTDASRRLAELLRADESIVLSLAAQTAAQGGHDALIAYGLSGALGAQIHAEALHGVQVRKTSSRRYVEGSMASQVIGLVGRDEQGLAGLEYQLDELLGGEAGLLVQEVDGLGNPIPFGPRAELPYQQGASIVLTIDRNLQWIAESTLQRAVEEWDAFGGHIIMMDPRNGDILALASLPTYNPMTIDLDLPESIALLRSRAASDIYEPGSTMKIVTMAAALDTGIVSPETTFIDTGAVVIEDRTIKNFDLSYHGEQTMTQVLQRSLNTGSVWVAQQLGARKFYEYLYRFGFGASTESGLPGEIGGVVTDSTDIRWSPSQLATNSFGQGIAVTPLQILQAYATVARGGVPIRPRLVSAIITDQGVQQFEPRVEERAISRETAATLTRMMQAVVDGVLGHPAQVEGWPVAGKSGTSDLVEDGVYIEDESIASFAGFAPADDPRIVVLIRIDRPQGELFGGIVAAPIFSDLMTVVLPYLGVPPTAYIADPTSWNTGPTGSIESAVDEQERGDALTASVEVEEQESPVTYIEDESDPDTAQEDVE
ncbi:MAG: penicillin-binding protein 2 [Chloroflexi bacterium]|nr:penicillin-binding protein 2 [Chloroflexota bacterium]MYF22065.1 penicillin-binding protein 2 [Chloroflexota bacterium]